MHLPPDDLPKVDVDDPLVNVRMRRSTRKNLKKLKGKRSYDDFFDKVITVFPYIKKKLDDDLDALGF